MNYEELWSERLRPVAEDLRRVEAPARVEARLLTAFREEAGSTNRRIRPRGTTPALAWAFAAAMAVLAVSLVRSRPPAAPPVTRPAVEWAVAGEGFMPLPDAPEIGAGEDLNLVRLEVPRSAVAVMGFPVNADGPAETVEADVVLGPDGLPRAVRFSE
jgi:hypothetical protein